MKTRQLGSKLNVSMLGLGCMGMSEFYGSHDDSVSLRVMARAVELGIDFFDTADMYGPHHNEELIGRFLKETKAPLKIATKFGINRKPGEYKRTIENSRQYARQACEASLKRLGLDYIDLYYVHRVNPAQPIEDVMGELSLLVEEGKIGNIGLCEVSEKTLRRAHAVHPIAAVQTEYSLWSRDVEEAILPTCRELGIGFVPYSPLGRGFLTGSFNSETQFEEGDFRANLPRFSKEALQVNEGITKVIVEAAAQKQCTPAQLSLAWLLAKGDDIVPIPGTKRLRYLEENIAATEIALSSEEVEALEAKLALISVVGERYTPEGMKGLNA
ncbi:Predicted oxidoreductase [Pseudovibrio denitrificans]|uniref:Predicted oxidoreductase n=1 Tax=Pseudovibrio denitrificans TaxID=258256 RepID=A0A1I7AUX2_9HYPH|nr:aldo/keto reductase [Pseudovibrio denitrificans]SFT78739.1 Predicted oxidoreductase [Pseudovibrio denitrificans]